MMRDTAMGIVIAKEQKKDDQNSLIQVARVPKLIQKAFVGGRWEWEVGEQN